MLFHKESNELPKLITVLGPTASGKTQWSIHLAREFGGEIISADSRQIYKKMDIGTAKPKGEWVRDGLHKTYVVEDIPHHLVDFLNPGNVFTAAEFRDKAIKHAKQIVKNQKIPFLVGGTGLYISSVVDNWQIPRVPPNGKLRRSLEEKNTADLLTLLHALDPVSAQNIDAQNKRRLVRALEVCIFSGQPFSSQRIKGDQLFSLLQIGIDVPREVLNQRIEERIDAMIVQGLLAEVAMMTKQKYGWSLPSMSGIGYRQFRAHLEGTESLERAIDLLKRDTRRFARRQMTWFRRDSRIQWCASYDDARALVKTFLQR